MATITVSRWLPGFQKVAFTKLLHGRAGMGLAEAKGQTDRLLDGDELLITLPNADAARALAIDMNALGLECRAEETGHDATGAGARRESAAD